MHSILASAAVLGSAALTMARPTEILGRSTFSVNQIEVGQKILSGPAEMMRTYQKYARIGATPPARVVSAAAAAQSGSVSANPTQYDSSYLCPVSAGGQTLNLDFDTGSSDLWVFSTETPSNEAGSHNLYDPTKSGTAKKIAGASWQISYGDGSGAGGDVYADTVVVGGVTATSQAVEAATSVSSEFTSDTGTDGLLGLAFSSINTVTPTKQKTFFDTVSSSLASALFTADLKKGEPGTYDFGYIDTSKYTGSVSYVPVDNSQGFWQFTAGGYAVGGSSGGGSGGNATAGSIGTAIADTGTTLLYLPTAAVSAYYAQVSGAQNDQTQGGYVFDCSATLPDFAVTIGSGTYTVPGSYINYAPVGSGSSQCFGGIQANTGIGLTIFGDIFLKSVFVVFDQSTGSPRLGLASKST